MAEQHMNLPWEVLDACNGFSLDIGGSAMKFLYIDKKDWKEPSHREKGSMGQICVKSFPHKEFQNAEALKLVKENVHLKKRGEEPPLILGTGMGVSMIQSQLNEEFGVNIQCEEESTCFTQALAYIVKHLPRRDVLYQFDPKERQAVLSQAKSMYSTTLQYKPMLNTRTRDEESLPMEDLWFVKDNQDADADKPLAIEENMFPCILVMCGSAFGSMLVYEDGSYDIINETPLGGKYWLGMTSLLNNAQNYDELMTLVQEGDSAPVHMAQSDFAAIDSGHENLNDGNLYEEFVDKVEFNSHTRIVYGFGKVTQENKGELKPEDLTRAFLDIMINDTVTLGMTAARITNARHVFYTGGFVSHPFIQKLMNTEWLKMWAEKGALDKKTLITEAHFLKHSSQMGALGALLRNLKK